MFQCFPIILYNSYEKEIICPYNKIPFRSTKNVRNPYFFDNSAILVPKSSLHTGVQKVPDYTGLKIVKWSRQML